MAFTLLSTLSVSAIVYISLGLLIAYNIISSIRSYLRLSHIPGPKLNAWSDIPLLWRHQQGTTFVDYGAWAAKYGSLVRIGTNQLITSDPDQWRAMHAVRSPYRRSDWYNGMKVNPGKHNVISMQDEAQHDELRRKMAAGYSGKENPRLEASIDNCVRDFVSLIERKYISDNDTYRPMDLGQKAQFFTLDVISDVAFDKAFGDLKDDKDNLDYIAETEASIPIVIMLTVLPRLHQFLEKSMIMNLVAPSAKDKTGLGKVIGVAVQKVAERFDADGKVKDRDDMLGSFLRHGLTREEAEGETVIQIVAGSDTTATAVRSTLLHIISNPQIHQKLLAEVSSAERAGLIAPTTSDQVISDETAKKLPYLQACIKEGLRIFPPVTGLTSKIPPAGGVTIDGYYVPEGTRIGYCAIGIHHSEAIFGPDAKLFRPERWFLKSDGGTCASAAQLTRMERNNELVFSYGRFQCLGKTVALIELNKVFVELLRRFEFQIVDPLHPWKSWCAGIFLQRDFWVRVTRREAKEDV